MRLIKETIVSISKDSEEASSIHPRAVKALVCGLGFKILDQIRVTDWQNISPEFEERAAQSPPAFLANGDYVYLNFATTTYNGCRYRCWAIQKSLVVANGSTIPIVVLMSLLPPAYVATEATLPPPPSYTSVMGANAGGVAASEDANAMDMYA
ncbi:hypothetical protein B0H63DRAFT_560382 [Podospora didyma]|uniref:Uncharacterized protein n=1 Tax=Podospora didyma TaxID=330526 RepID=A0AAE0NQN2_9PEZI|nr:hypothetical protein B0H63DRAFT_560382 [Podospora didyma]